MMGALGEIESGVVGTVTGSIWKVAAIGLLVGMITSNAYLGYQWHAAAGQRDTAIAERHNAEAQRDRALSDNGELRGAIANQNDSIAKLTAQTAIARARYETAMQLFAPINKRITSLADSIAALPHSTTCAQALSKQRQAIDGLKKVQK